MLTKDTVRHLVHQLLSDQVEQELLSKNPDMYYGWVAPATDPETGTTTPGYWLGEADVAQAEYRVVTAELQLNGVSARLDEADPSTLAAVEAAKANLRRAIAAVDEARSYAERTIEARRHQVINRRVAKRFIQYYRKATTLNWKLYDPAIPEGLRNYALRQLARGPIAPTSIVLLYLIIESTRQHGAEFQTQSLTAYNYLADNPLATAALDIDVPENLPSRAKRAYIRELQAEAIRARKGPAHQNYDPRDVLADFEYHGLPEQLGAMWITKDADCCDHCKQGLRVRMVHAGSGYRYAKVCPNYQEDTHCHYELMSPARASRKQLRDWAIVEWASGQALEPALDMAVVRAA